MEESNDNERLRREFDALPKTPDHGETVLERHPEILPEWVMRIIYDPYGRWQEISASGETSTVLAGRVPEFSQWIRVVLLGDDNLFHTAYPDHRLADLYGGRPWRSAQ